MRQALVVPAVSRRDYESVHQSRRTDEKIRDSEWLTGAMEVTGDLACANGAGHVDGEHFRR